MKLAHDTKIQDLLLNTTLKRATGMESTTQLGSLNKSSCLHVFTTENLTLTTCPRPLRQVAMPEKSTNMQSAGIGTVNKPHFEIYP